MDNTIRIFSGKAISLEDIETIKWVRHRFPQLSRTEFTATICEILEWTTPAGRSKLPQCMAALEELESEGVLELPVSRGNKKSISLIEAKIEEPCGEITGNIVDFEPIRLEIAKGREDSRLWRTYVDRYHMLGHKTVFGSRLNYFIKSNEIMLGCIQFSASAWSLQGRDQWIGWDVDDRKKRLHLIVNNSRYLIFPWVRIKNLASKALALAAKQIQGDWLREYCYSPVLLETFVDLEHFNGTCYKAANWSYLGKTKGRGRMDRNQGYSLSRKAIFVYPLQKDFKECLRGEKPYKAVNPDEQ